MDINERIEQLCLERGWTSYRLAKESGLSQSTITNLFKRNNLPRTSTLERLCKAFGITLGQFLGEEESFNELTAEQRELFKRWSCLNEQQKKVLLDLMSIM